MEDRRKLLVDTYTLPSIPYTQHASSLGENQGSGDYSQDGSVPSSSSTSSERIHLAGLLDDADDVQALLKDYDVRAMLKKVTVNEGVLNKAIQSLGGGEKGLKSLMKYIIFWVKQQRQNIQSSQRQPSNPEWNFSTTGDAVLQRNSDAFQIISGILQTSSKTEVSEQGAHPFQRFKSRRLMMGEPDMDAGLGGLDSGFCPSSFISTPEDYKPDMANAGITVVTPCIPQMNYGMQEQQPALSFTTAHVALPFVEQTPALTTKAARRHRMARQRQLTHARAAGHAAATPVSVGGGLTWNNAAAPSALKSSGMPGPQSSPQNDPVTAARKSRVMESLTLLLQKDLRPSDVGNLGRIIIPKREAEQHMPYLVMRGGVSMQMEDFDTGHVWNLRYSVTTPPKVGSSTLVTSDKSSFWPNNKSRMYLLENTGEFVKSRRLAEGDLLMIYRTQQGSYVLRGKKKRTQRLDTEPVEVKFAHSLAKGSREELGSPKENGILISRLYGGGPSDKCVKEEPLTSDNDPFLKEMMLSMGPSFGSDSSCLQTLERFPSLNLDFPIEEIMAASKTQPEG